MLSIPLIIQCGSIIFSTHYKFRYYKITLYRLKTRKFKKEYFEEEMHEPCMRLIIKDLLKQNGFLEEYYELKKYCKGRNFRIENAKERLLAKVIEKK